MYAKNHECLGGILGGLLLAVMARIKIHDSMASRASRALVKSTCFAIRPWGRGPRDVWRNMCMSPEPGMPGMPSNYVVPIWANLQTLAVFAVSGAGIASSGPSANMRCLFDIRSARVSATCTRVHYTKRTTRPVGNRRRLAMDTASLPAIEEIHQPTSNAIPHASNAGHRAGCKETCLVDWP